MVFWLAFAATGCAAVGAAHPGTATVARGPFEDVFLLTGELQSTSSIEITAPALDQVQIRWLAEDGSQVEAGAPVVEFDDTSVLTNLEEQRTELAQSEIRLESEERELDAEGERRRAALGKAEVELRKARVEAEVPRELRSSLEWRKAQEAKMQAEIALEKARLDLEAFSVSSAADRLAARLEVEKNRRKLETAEDSLHSASVRAPRGGLFLVGRHWRRDEDRPLQAGDNLFPGILVASIPDPAGIRVAARLADVDSGRIAHGMPARMYLDAWPDREFRGSVEEVGSVASEGFFPVRVSIQDSDPDVMRPGLSVRVEVMRERSAEALLIPRGAVQFAEGRGQVRRERSEVLQPVDLGPCNPLACVVKSGLDAGDRVRLF